MSWETIKLGDYIETLTDYHANGAYKKLKANVKLKYKPDYALMIRTLNFEQNDFSSNLIWLNETEYNFLSKSKVYPDDIIMNKIANAGSVYIMPNLNRPVSLAMNLFLIRFKELNQRFMYYLMKTNEPYIKSFANGVATQSITKDAVRNLEFKIPNNTTQKKIASILSTYDDLIENNLKRIKLLEEAAQRLYKEWFVDFKFPNYENTPINPETGLPDGWERKPISNFIKLIHGCSFKAKEFSDSKDYYLVIRMGNFKENGGLQLNKNVRYLPKYKEIKNKYLLEEGDLLMVLSDVTREGRIIGNVGLIPSNNQKYVLNQRVAKLEINVKNYKTYFYSVLNSENFKEYCRPRANGATVLNLKTKDVTDYNIVIPDSTTLNSFSIKSKRILDNIENLEKQNQNLKEARDLLLPRLMNKTIEV
ncbi:MAG TPA: restriction endonuclease subunit S [Xanthomarina sp.]|nr:restriction endonuclease subunit S [Xanthomarina sp.]